MEIPTNRDSDLPRQVEQLATRGITGFARIDDHERPLWLQCVETRFASVTGGERPASNIYRVAKNLATVSRSKRTHDIDIAALDKIPKPSRRQNHRDGQASNEQQNGATAPLICMLSHSVIPQRNAMIKVYRCDAAANAVDWYYEK